MDKNVRSLHSTEEHSEMMSNHSLRQYIIFKIFAQRINSTRLCRAFINNQVCKTIRLFEINLKIIYKRNRKERIWKLSYSKLDQKL